MKLYRKEPMTGGEIALWCCAFGLIGPFVLPFLLYRKIHVSWK